MSPARLISPEEWVPSGIERLEAAALEAVRATGNTLVTAGPGAGKTELLGQRGVFLLQTGACPNARRILAISYKRDAARNLRERFQRRCTREQAARLDSMTFDAFAKQLLDKFWRALPDPWRLSKLYRVAGIISRPEIGQFQASSAGALKSVNAPAGWAARLANVEVSAGDVHAVNYDSFNLAVRQLTLSPLSVPTVPALLQLALFRRNFQMDPVPLTFPMIGRLAEFIIVTNPKIREAFLAAYSHVFIDELQDTSGVQYGLLKAIFCGSGSIVTAVGDDKQRIMGWAGAQNDSFGVFKKDFLSDGEGCGQRHLMLTLNYRSNTRIVEILNTLKRRLAPSEPDFKAVRPAPSLPPEQICAVLVSPHSGTEAEMLASFVEKEVHAGIAPRSIGLLVRQKAVDWEKKISPAFQRRKIGLRNEDRDVGGASIQDLMTEPYTQAVIDCLDLLTRRRGGDVWVRVLDTLCEMEGIISEEEAEQVQRVAVRLDEFHQRHRIARPQSGAKPDIVVKKIEEIEILFELGRLKGAAPHYQQGDFFDRVRNATRTFMRECTPEGATWLSVLSSFRGDKHVPLMTITKSKGLEYDIVMLLGLDDSDWWSFDRNPDEGHSNFFVAASRARERLFMTLCQGQRTAKIAEIYELLKQAGVRELTSDLFQPEKISAKI